MQKTSHMFVFAIAVEIILVGEWHFLNDTRKTRCVRVLFSSYLSGKK